MWFRLGLVLGWAGVLADVGKTAAFETKSSKNCPCHEGPRVMRCAAMCNAVLDGGRCS